MEIYDLKQNIYWLFETETREGDNLNFDAKTNCKNLDTLID